MTIAAPHRISVLAVLAAALVALLVPSVAAAGERPRLAIREVTATRSVARQAKEGGYENALDQVVESIGDQLLDAFDDAGAFEMVARADLPGVLKEQDLSLSGNVNMMDPQAAQAYRLAGARFVATVTVNNFQEVVERTVLPGQFGDAKAEPHATRLIIRPLIDRSDMVDEGRARNRHITFGRIIPHWPERSGRSGGAPYRLA